MIVGLTLAATLAACGSVAETPVHPVADLAGTEWLLARLPGDQPIPRGMEITLNWQGDGIRGHAGCNGYFSEFSEGDKKGALTIGPVGSTRMACPPKIMKAESEYFRAHDAVVAYEYSGNDLILNFRIDDTAGTLPFTPLGVGNGGRR